MSSDLLAAAASGVDWEERETGGHKAVYHHCPCGGWDTCLHVSVWLPVCLTDHLSVWAEADLKKGEVSCEEVLLLGGAVQMEALVAVVTRMFVKYWIYVCGTMFFFVSFEGKIVLYKVIYMVMFLCCVALYQVKLQVLQYLKYYKYNKYFKHCKYYKYCKYFKWYKFCKSCY